MAMNIEIWRRDDWYKIILSGMRIFSLFRVEHHIFKIEKFLHTIFLLSKTVYSVAE